MRVRGARLKKEEDKQAKEQKKKADKDREAKKQAEKDARFEAQEQQRCVLPSAPKRTIRVPQLSFRAHTPTTAIACAVIVTHAGVSNPYSLSTSPSIM